MIICHKYKFIFIKTNKTAGTSIEIALSKFCGAEDVITPVSVEDEELRQSAGGRAPQNYLKAESEYSLKDHFNKIVYKKKKLKYYNHIGARQIKKYVGSEIWNNYFKFCFERNPWDRLLSFYYWKNKSEELPSIMKFLNSKDARILRERGFGLYTIDNQVVVDKIYRFENIAEDFADACQKIGLPEVPELPRAKSGVRKDKRSYKEILSDTEAEKIADMFSDEIKILGYQY